MNNYIEKERYYEDTNMAINKMDEVVTNGEELLEEVTITIPYETLEKKHIILKPNATKSYEVLLPYVVILLDKIKNKEMKYDKKGIVYEDGIMCYVYDKKGFRGEVEILVDKHTYFPNKNKVQGVKKLFRKIEEYNFKNREYFQMDAYVKVRYVFDYPTSFLKSL